MIVINLGRDLTLQLELNYIIQPHVVSQASSAGQSVE